MLKDSKIYVAGHRGLVGSAIVRELQKQGYHNLILRTHKELDLTNQKVVSEFFAQEKPEYVFLAAAKAGGILANNTYRAEFLYQNLMIECNVIHQSFKNDVKKLVFCASTSIYPKSAPQPIKEECLLSGVLDYTFESYAIAKISGIKLCESYNIQYGTNFIGVSPTCIYGENDNFHFQNAQVLPALLRKFHLAKLLEQGRNEEILQDLGLQDVDLAIQECAKIGITEDSVQIWGSGAARREFMYSSDCASALIFIMNNVDFKDLRGEEKEIRNTQINIGIGQDIAIKDLALLIKEIVGFGGGISFDVSKPDGALRKLIDTNRLENFGWSAKVGLKEGIQMMYEWYQNTHSRTSAGGGFKC